jgi:hypothetical protein
MNCHCGCDQPAKRNFLPGHDQKLRIRLEKQVGGLLQLEALLDLNRAFLVNSEAPELFKQEVGKLFQLASSQ